MTKKEMLQANNELLAALCAAASIETTVIEGSRDSIGGGGISRPTGNGNG